MRVCLPRRMLACANNVILLIAGFLRSVGLQILGGGLTSDLLALPDLLALEDARHRGVD